MLQFVWIFPGFDFGFFKMVLVHFVQPITTFSCKTVYWAGFPHTHTFSLGGGRVPCPHFWRLWLQELLDFLKKGHLQRDISTIIKTIFRYLSIGLRLRQDCEYTTTNDINICLFLYVEQHIVYATYSAIWRDGLNIDFRASKEKV